MMWADRIGIGLTALVLLGGLVVGALDGTKKAQGEQAAKYTAEVARCNSLPPMPKEHKSSEPDVDSLYLYRWASGIGCPPDEPVPDTRQTYRRVCGKADRVCGPANLGNLADSGFHVRRSGEPPREESINALTLVSARRGTPLASPCGVCRLHSYTQSWFG